jgi:hypothetical protein
MTPHHHEFRSDHVKNEDNVPVGMAHPPGILNRHFESSKERCRRVETEHKAGLLCNPQAYNEALIKRTDGSNWLR